jgi:hypothetical protein
MISGTIPAGKVYVCEYSRQLNNKGGYAGMLRGGSWSWPWRSEAAAMGRPGGAPGVSGGVAPPNFA